MVPAFPPSPLRGYHSVMDRHEHWERVYATKGEREVSWFESAPAVSLRLMEAAGLTPDTCVLDVGGGDSRLVDCLAARGLDCLAVLDVSEGALQRARVRLGAAARVPMWIASDVTGSWTLKPMDIWHDRAVFHFLVERRDRVRYLIHLRDTLKQDGAAIIATFAPDGPETCSGLPVARYSPESLAAELGGVLQLVESIPYVHTTPWGETQAFQYSRFTRVH
jgi:SAM-dependent methyltransferase